MPMRPSPFGPGPDQPAPRPSVASVRMSGCLPGTLVLTQDGEIPVEFLTPGDKIITREQGYVPLLALLREEVMTHAVKVRCGALGPQRPSADLILPTEQPLLLRGECAVARTGRAQAFVRAGKLADGDGVTDMGLMRMELYSLAFETRQVIYAGGLEMSGVVPEADPGRRAA